MAFEKGHKFGKGNKGAKLIEEALRRAALQEDGARIRAGVEKLLDKFAAGDLIAFGIVADRIDGRPNQQVEMSVNRDTRDYSVEELLERLAELRRGNSAGATGSQAGAAKPSELH